MPAPSPLRETLYQVIFHVDTAAGRRFDTWLIVLILASLLLALALVILLLKQWSESRIARLKTGAQP